MSQTDESDVFDENPRRVCFDLVYRITQDDRFKPAPNVQNIYRKITIPFIATQDSLWRLNMPK